MTKMNPKVKALWVASLRDGSFEQGKYALRELGDLYDPCGVLCELAVSAGILAPATEYSKDNGAEVFFGYTYGEDSQKSATILPEPVGKWAGISTHIGYRLSLMGDNGKSFDEIATYIEEVM